MSDTSGSFLEFQELCDKIVVDPSYTAKTKIIKKFIEGPPRFSGNLYLLCRFLIIKEDQRVFHIKEKSLIKLLASILNVDPNLILSDLQQNDIATTASKVRSIYNVFVYF